MHRSGSQKLLHTSFRSCHAHVGYGGRMEDSGSGACCPQNPISSVRGRWTRLQASLAFTCPAAGGHHPQRCEADNATVRVHNG